MKIYILMVDGKFGLDYLIHSAWRSIKEAKRKAERLEKSGKSTFIEKVILRQKRGDIK